MRTSRGGSPCRRAALRLICLCKLLGCTAHEHQAGSLPDYIGGYRVNLEVCQNVLRDCAFSTKVATSAGDIDMQLSHCLHDATGQDKRQGAFVFSRTNPAPGDAHDIYRVRMVGHELLAPQLYACNSTLIVGPYIILIGGLYRVAVLQTYDSFTFEFRAQPRSYQSMLLASFAMEVVSPDLGWGCAWEEACPICSDQAAEGRWLVRDPRLLGELHYCAAGCNIPEIEALRTRKSAIPGISWQPYTCSLAPLEDIDLQICLKDRDICLVGDSHMRHIQNGLTSLILDDADHHNWDPSPDKSKERLKADKTVGALEGIKYFADTWGNPWNVHNLSACTDIYANFGSWPASYETGSVAWPLHQFALAAGNQADFLVSLKHEGKHVYWVNSPSHAPDPARTGIDDWRSDRLLTLYNDISSKALADKDIPIIDQYSITDPLHDMSYDTYHFKGLVGYYIHLHILNVICSSARNTVQVKEPVVSLLDTEKSGAAGNVE